MTNNTPNKTPKRRIVQKRVPNNQSPKNNDHPKNYELHLDETDGLQYVRLRKSGLEKISAQYAEKYENKKLKIDVFAENHATSEAKSLQADNQPDKDKLILELTRTADKLQNGEVRGLAYLINNKHGNVMHAMPFVVAKTNNGLVEVVDFEDYLPAEKIEGFNRVRSVKNYKKNDVGLSKNDHNSCTVFAIDTLKNCLIDDAFVKDVTSGSRHPVILNKMILGQNQSFIENLSEEKRIKYVRDLKDENDLEAGEVKQINLKAFYKGHFYANKLNPEHLNLLDDTTKKKVLEIDHTRREAKTTNFLDKKNTDQATNALAKKWLQDARNNIVKKQKLSEIIEKKEDAQNKIDLQNAFNKWENNTQISNPRTPEIEEEIKPEIKIKLPSSSPSKGESGFVVTAFVNERKVKAKTGVWVNTERQNNYRTLDGAYNNFEEELLMMLNILIKITADPRIKKLNGGKDLELDKLLEIIKTAKEKGGISHKKSGATEGYEKQDNIDVLGKTASGIYQKECEECGVYSGRKTSGIKNPAVGSRMTFIPDKVEEGLRVLTDIKKSVEASKKLVDAKKNEVKNILEERAKNPQSMYSDVESQTSL